MSLKLNKEHQYSFMDQTFLIIITNMRYNIYLFSYKIFELNILIYSKLFNKTFLYPFQNNFSSKSNQIYSKYFYSSYQITNGVQLGETSQMSG